MASEVKELEFLSLPFLLPLIGPLEWLWPWLLMTMTGVLEEGHAFKEEIKLGLRKNDWQVWNLGSLFSYKENW